MYFKRTGKAYFIRKPSNYIELEKVSINYYNRSYQEIPYKIIAIIKVDRFEYEYFKNHLIGKNYSFLTKYIEKMSVLNGVVQCVLITIENNEVTGILVNSEGTLYARYCAIWKK